MLCATELMMNAPKAEIERCTITDQSGHFADPILHCGQWDLAGPK